MKSPLASLLVMLALAGSGHLVAAESTELAEARGQLLEKFRSGYTDEHPSVKQLRAKIAALEYIDANATGPAIAVPTQKLVNIDFPGGSLGALVVAINKDGAGFNLIGEKTDLAIDLPPFSLRNADAIAVANALTGLLQTRGFALQGPSRTAAGQSPVFVLRKLLSHEGNQFVQFQSFQLAPYLEQQSVDDIITAMRAAWELDPAHTPTALRLKFHPATSILLVSAPPDGVTVVQTVLSQLRKNGDSGNKSAQKTAPPPAAPDRR